MTLRELLKRFALGAAVGLTATIMYHGTQYLGASRAIMRTSCWTWRIVPFNPLWFWPYISLFVLLGLPWFVLRTWSAVRAYAAALLAVAAVAWLTFVIYPTACVRPSELYLPSYLSTFYLVDWPNNCFPCLHSAFAVYGGYVMCCRASYWDTPVPKVVIYSWVVAILVSIVALRQHTGIDAVTGIGLGAIGIWLFRSLRSADNAA